MLFNCLLVFLPLAAVIVLDVFEGGLLVSQENTMASQARVLASALGASPDWRAWALASLDRLKGRTLTRLRVLDTQGRVIADTSRWAPQTPIAADGRSNRTVAAPEKPATDSPFTSLIYQLGSLPFRLTRAILPPEAPTEVLDDQVAKNPAVTNALNGRYGAHTQVSTGQRSVTLYSAVPIESANGDSVGVVLASQSTWRTLRALYETRVTLFQVFLASVAAALALSFLLSLTITRPILRLKGMAEGFIDQWGRPTGQFQPLKGRDELAILSRSLVRLGDGISDHVRFIESFAADLTHELRNPLAAIRAAGELLGQNQSGEVARLADIVQFEADRIDRLAAVARELGRLDVAVARAPRSAIDLGTFLQDATRAWQLQGKNVTYRPSERGSGAGTVRANPDLLRQALDKLVENALDYSPSVDLAWHRRDAVLEWSVADRGPGVPLDQRAEIFRRFHTTRRDHGHTGLGLALVQTIVEAFGGSVSVTDRPGGGAVFTVTLPQV